MTTDQPAHRVTVLGAGVMGTNITAVALGHGVPVVLVDLDESILDMAERRIRAHLRHAKLMKVLPSLPEGELTATTDITRAADSTVVIEAITEQTDLKVKVLGEVSALVRPGTPLITNTSGIPIDELADAVPRPGELAGAHFMNPTYLIKMVEVIRGPRTGEATMASVKDLLSALGRQVVVVADAPGFVTSRLLHPMINAAANVVGAGTASVEDVDTLMQGCLGHPTGPLRTADLIGIDNLVDSLAAMHERTGDPACLPSQVLLDKVREGALGLKSGHGFYDYGKAQQ